MEAPPQPVKSPPPSPPPALLQSQGHRTGLYTPCFPNDIRLELQLERTNLASALPGYLQSRYYESFVCSDALGGPGDCAALWEAHTLYGVHYPVKMRMISFGHK